eukprot:m.270562 g.270562  ORF g.270562 m.270562 type:complete len:311 (-) comp19738_c0_seq1:422-1354(-)
MVGCARTTASFSVLTLIFVSQVYVVICIGDLDSDDCNLDSTKPSCCGEHHCGIVRKSTLFSTCCKTTATNLWPLLVSATPRSGTNYIVYVLQELGLRVNNDYIFESGFRNWSTQPGWFNHELHTGDVGLVSWIHLFADRNYFGPGKLNGGRFKAIVHLVRDPLPSITSIAFTEPMLQRSSYRNFVARHITLHMPGPEMVNTAQVKLYLAMQFYLGWHRFLDSLHVPRFLLENITVQTVQMILRAADLPSAEPATIQNILDTAGAQNQRKHRAEVTWEELCAVNRTLTAEIWELTQGYGYNTEKKIESPCA